MIAERQDKVGNCKIYLGDCRNILPKLGFTPNAVITDPPYDNPYIPIYGEGNTVVFCDPLNRPQGEFDEVLFWVKPQSTKNTKKRCSRFVEEIMVKRKGVVFNQLHWSQMTGVYDDRKVERNPVHPHEKPLSLLERIVRIYTNVGDLVVDPFMGSGTTGVACAKLGRKFIGIEEYENYYNKAWTRIFAAHSPIVGKLDE